MHRALGGAPTSRVLPLGFCGQKPRWAPALAGRLLANAKRVRRGLASGKAKLKNSVPSASVRATRSLYTLKTNFFRKELGRYIACDNLKTSLDGAMPRLLRAMLQRTARGRVAAPTPRPA